MLTAALTAFVAVFLAEIGDKTQLVSLSMACRYPPLQVLGGAMAALALVVGMGVGAGAFILAIIPHSLITITSGLMFIVIGAFTYFKKEQKSSQCTARTGFMQTMIMIFIAEFGDKSQLAALFLVTGLGYPLAVFTGAMLAMLLNHALAIYLGSRFLARLDPRIIKMSTAALFVVIGLAVLVLEY